MRPSLTAVNFNMFIKKNLIISPWKKRKVLTIKHIQTNEKL